MSSTPQTRIGSKWLCIVVKYVVEVNALRVISARTYVCITKFAIARTLSPARGTLALPGKSVHERNARLSILFGRHGDTDSLWPVELRVSFALSLGDVTRF